MLFCFNVNAGVPMPDFSKMNEEELEKGLLLLSIPAAIEQGVPEEEIVCRNRIMFKTVCSIAINKCTYRQYLLDRLSGKNVDEYMRKFNRLPSSFYNQVMQGVQACSIDHNLYKDF